MQVLIFLFIFLLGFIFGSFVNVLIYRLPIRKPITGRSLCPNCQKQIAWFDNVPLLSFILLRGKCRNCSKKISIRYPLIELLTAIGFLLIYLLFKGQSVFEIGYLLFVFVLLLPIFVIDLIHQIVPDELVFCGVALVFLFLLLSDSQSIFSSLFASFVSASFILSIHLITKGKGMGLGDVKLALFLGVFLGVSKIIPWFYLSFLTGALVGIILILVRKAKFGKPIAFGPFLILGLIGAYFWGDKLIGLILK